MEGFIVLHFLAKTTGILFSFINELGDKRKLRNVYVSFYNKNHSIIWASSTDMLYKDQHVSPYGAQRWSRSKIFQFLSQYWGSMKKVRARLQMVESIMCWFRMHLQIAHCMYQAQLSSQGNAITYLKLPIFKPEHLHFWANIPQRETEYTADALEGCIIFFLGSSKLWIINKWKFF